MGESRARHSQPMCLAYLLCLRTNSLAQSIGHHSLVLFKCHVDMSNSWGTQKHTHMGTQEGQELLVTQFPSIQSNIGGNGGGVGLILEHFLFRLTKPTWEPTNCVRVASSIWIVFFCPTKLLYFSFLGWITYVFRCMTILHLCDALNIV